VSDSHPTSMADDAAQDAVDEELEEFDFSSELEASRRLSDRSFGWILIVLGAVAFFASMALSIEKFLKLSNPDHVASCSFNLFLDCADAMASSQGAIFGFPNPLIGVFAFTIVITSGVVLVAGAKLPRWYWLALLTGTTLGLAMIVFLMYTSIHVLQRLCPYCMVVWSMMLPLWWYQIVRAVQERYLPASEKFRTSVMKNKHLMVPILIAAVILWIALGMGGVIIEYINRPV
jgi:uncharacterized membrane protein